MPDVTQISFTQARFIHWTSCYYS